MFLSAQTNYATELMQFVENDVKQTPLYYQKVPSGTGFDKKKT